MPRQLEQSSWRGVFAGVMMLVLIACFLSTQGAAPPVPTIDEEHRGLEQRQLEEVDAPQAPVASKSARDIFGVIDVDDEGTISWSELGGHLTAAGYTAAAVASVFKTLDANSDGIISQEEFRIGFEASQPEVPVESEGATERAAVVQETPARADVSRSELPSEPMTKVERPTAEPVTEIVETPRQESTTAAAGSIQPRKASCEDRQKDCARWAARGECGKNPTFMQNTCRLSCGACHGLSAARPVHHMPAVAAHFANRQRDEDDDEDDEDDHVHERKEESSHSPTSHAECSDSHGECGKWASWGECPRNPSFMHVQCRRSCNLCRPAGSTAASR